MQLGGMSRHFKKKFHDQLRYLAGGFQKYQPFLMA